MSNPPQDFAIEAWPFLAILWPMVILAAGVAVVWLLYADGYEHFRRKGDRHGCTVTAIAAAGTFLPFMGFAFFALTLALERTGA